MELRNDDASYQALSKCVIAYYKSNGRDCVQIGPTEIKNKQFFGATVATQNFFISPRLWVWIHLATGGRDEVCGLNFASESENNLDHLWDALSRSKFEELYNDKLTTEAVVHNLKMLDEYLAGRLNRPGF
jgi:hypothetical protein